MGRPFNKYAGSRGGGAASGRGNSSRGSWRGGPGGGRGGGRGGYGQQAGGGLKTATEGTREEDRVEDAKIWDQLDDKLGFPKFQEGHSRQGWLVNMKEVSLPRSLSPQVYGELMLHASRRHSYRTSSRGPARRASTTISSRTTAACSRPRSPTSPISTSQPE